MPLISDLKVIDLRDLLRERDLSTNGSKAELIERLIAAEGTEEIELDESRSDESMRAQIDDLRSMIENVMTIVQRQTNQNAQPSTSSETRNEVHEHQSRSPVSNRESRQRNVYSVKEISDTLPEYDPTKDSIFSVEQFIDRVEKSMRAYDWDERCLMLAIYSKLKGPARLWLDASADLFVTWPDLATALKQEFSTVPDEADIHFKMSNATRKNEESINEYCFRMSALGRRHGLSESAIIKYTREGLKHRELQVAIATVRFKSMKEMREALDEYFTNIAGPSSSRTMTAPKRMDNNNKNVNKTPDSGAKPKTERKSIVCFNCSEPGHISSACPKPQRRKRCKDCQRVHPRGSPENCGKSDVRNTNSVRKYCADKKVRVNGVEMCALIDTGSECSMIQKSKAAKIDNDRKTCSVRINGVGGGTRVLNEMINVEITVDEVELSVDLYVADDDTFSTDVIIGNDIFANNSVRLICKENGQRFEYLSVDNTEMNELPCNKITEIKYGEIDKTTQSRLFKLIDEYRDVFGKELSEIGLTSAVRMKIKLLTNEPIVTKPYRLPEMKKESVRQLINELLTNDIIIKSTSEYASPIVLVKKKNGDDRLCIDYRRLNQITVNEIFPTPNIEELGFEQRILSNTDRRKQPEVYRLCDARRNV
ncbi:uncharacterized protein LOC135952661 [Calliphora vicina]|uniref:uncharacterized protein LOC135952661 n=1 Tax=Calliphora vicina TaxID=7373 RepID=UPI00325A627A